jgi:hypothetical protein
MAPTQPLRVGFVPEHFSTPIHFAKKHYGLDAELIPFPSGTGHMITALRSGEIDVGIGLTEGWVAALGKSQESGDADGGYRLVGTYVETPLCKHLQQPLCWPSTVSDADISAQAGQSRRVPTGPRSPPSTLSRLARLACRASGPAAT